MEFTDILYMYLGMAIFGIAGGAFRLINNPLKNERRVICRELLGGMLAGIMGGGIVSLYTCHAPWIISLSILCGVCYDEVFACGLNIIKKVVGTVLNIAKTGK